MWQETGRLYTYCHDYQSMTLVPEDLEQAQNSEQHHKKKLWQTTQGFVYPGLRTSLESNKHPIPLDRARQEELTKVRKLIVGSHRGRLVSNKVAFL